jgi:SAP domain protein|nr:MAG TPA: Protein inhibitor of activated STAT helix bundle, RIKEN Structural [Caudoviricetes sp.]DAN82662.1 MAG TPA: Protein inhibitor of activated STAT helix bundle, RIKEN Structural [Caudoviricetes sp.]
MSFLTNLLNSFKKPVKSPVIDNTKENDNSLQMGDIILLYWIENSPHDNFPAYFEYDYHINPQLHRNKLINMGMLEFQKSQKSLSKLKVIELKEILKNESLPTSGKKDQLVQRIIDNFDILETRIPQALCLTESGEQVLLENQNLIKAHQDQYISAVEYKDYSIKFPEDSYDDIKIKILNDQMAKNVREQRFGLVRINNLALGDLYQKQKEYKIALKYFIKAMLFDCSGLKNSYEYIPHPIYTEPILNSFIITEIRNISDMCDLDDYSNAFELAKKEIKSLRKKIFLTEKDFDFIKHNLLVEDLDIIETYLKKYSKFTYEYYN